MYSLLLAIIYVSFVGLGLPDSLLGSAWPTMHQQINAPVTFAGVISMLICFCTILSSLMSDRLTSRFGAGKVTAISVLLSSFSLLGFALSTTTWMVILLAIPYGFCAGAVDSALNNYVALHYESKHMSWLHCFWGLGASISPCVMGFAIANLNSWGWGYGIICIVQVCISIALFISLPLWKKNTTSEVEQKRTPTPLKEIFKIRGAIYCFIAFFCYCGMENTVMIWASSYMTIAKDIPPSVASSYASLFFIGITVGRAVNGFLTLKFSDKTLIRLGEGVILLGIGLVALPFDQIFTIIGFVTIGLGCAPIYPSIIHMTPSLFGQDKSQAMIGVQMACAYTGSCVVSPVFGFTADLLGFWIMPIFLLVFASILIIMHETVIKKTSITSI